MFRKNKGSGTFFFCRKPNNYGQMRNTVIDGRTRKDSIRPATGYSAKLSPYMLNVMVSQVVADIADKVSQHEPDEKTGCIAFEETAEITMNGHVCFYVDYEYYLSERTVIVTEHMGATLYDTEIVDEEINVKAVSNGDYDDFNQYVSLLNQRLKK